MYRTGLLLRPPLDRHCTVGEPSSMASLSDGHAMTGICMVRTSLVSVDMHDSVMWYICILYVYV